MGRPKGSVNKERELFQEKARELGIDLFKTLLLFSAGDWKALGYEAEAAPSAIGQFGTVYKYTIDPAVRLKATTEAMNYIAPKLRSIEVTGTNGDPIEIDATSNLQALLTNPETFDAVQKLADALNPREPKT